jgi:hypothetical protein
MKARKRYTPMPATKPERRLGSPVRATSDRTDRNAKSEAPTLPPPPMKEGDMERNRSGVRARKSQQPPPAATVDEVTADLSKDPRREQE